MIEDLKNELLAAVEHQASLAEKHKAEIKAAKQRVVDAVNAIAEIEIGERLRVALAVYSRAPGAKRILAAACGLTERRMRWLISPKAPRPCHYCQAPVPADWHNFETGSVQCVALRERSREQSREGWAEHREKVRHWGRVVRGTRAPQ